MASKTPILLTKGLSPSKIVGFGGIRGVGGGKIPPKTTGKWQLKRLLWTKRRFFVWPVILSLCRFWAKNKTKGFKIGVLRSKKVNLVFLVTYIKNQVSGPFWVFSSHIDNKEPLFKLKSLLFYPFPWEKNPPKTPKTQLVSAIETPISPSVYFPLPPKKGPKPFTFSNVRGPQDPYFDKYSFFPWKSIQFAAII